MDGESSYESDISESWSLIDINLNEESLSVTEVPSDLEITPLPELKKVKSRRLNETELKDFAKKCKEVNQLDFGHVCDSDSNSSLKSRELQTSSNTELDGIDSSSKSLENEKNDSGDDDSIEILDMDGSEISKLDISGINQLSTYQSDDEDSLDDRSLINIKKNSSTVIMRKRRKLNRSFDDTVNNVNSENRFLAESNSSASSNHSKEESCTFFEESNKINGHPVYKHYRNNVANTVLSLSVGIIFAGVACIAIGHFLGVQDASENAVELVGTLKKLQAENAALQSRLFHLNRALLTRDTTSKVKLPPNQQVSEILSEQTPRIDPTKILKFNLNNAAVSEIRSSLNSIEWLSRLQNFVKKNKVTDTEYEIDFNRIGKFIHDQLHSLNNRKADGAKLLEDTDKKLSKVLKKIVTRLSSSQDHIENFYERLIKFKDKLNQKLKKMFPDSSGDLKPENWEIRKKIPVTELDLQTIKWNPEKKLEGSSFKARPESILSYKFLQPKNYYDNDRNVKSSPRNVFEIINSSTKSENKSNEKVEKVVKQNKKKQKNEENNKKEKKKSKDDWKKKKFKEKKGEKKQKRAVNNVQKASKNFVNESNDVFIGPKPFRERNDFNETFFEYKKYVRAKDLKAKDKNVKSKRKSVKKNSKFKKVFTKLKKRSQLKKKHYEVPEYFNVTGYWVFKWADGREEIRRHQARGDWQFERAKVRKELRDEDYEDNWQFKRASGRETNRNGDRWHRRKYEKYLGKEFFHDRFSWI